MAVKQRKPRPVRGSEMHRAGKQLQADRKVLIRALDQINRTIYAVGAPLGSEAYFRIRELCMASLDQVGAKIS